MVAVLVLSTKQPNQKRYLASLEKARKGARGLGFADLTDYDLDDDDDDDDYTSPIDDVCELDEMYGALTAIQVASERGRGRTNDASLVWSSHDHPLFHAPARRRRVATRG